MKRTVSIALVLSVFCCFLYAMPCSAESGTARFGTGVTKDWDLVGEAGEFSTNLITCGFFCEKPLGAMQVAVSIYLREKAGGAEQVVVRTNIDINPEWNILFLPDIPLPSTGEYTFNLSTLAGEGLASGKVKITEKKVEEKMPEQPKVDGTTVEGLFNKFMPKN